MTAPFRPGSGRRWKSRQRPERLCSPQCRARNVGLSGASGCRRWRRRSRWSFRPWFLRNGPQRTPGRGGRSQKVGFSHCLPKYKIKLRQTLGGVIQPHWNVRNTQKEKPWRTSFVSQQLNRRGSVEMIHLGGGGCHSGNNEVPAGSSCRPPPTH